MPSRVLVIGDTHCPGMLDGYVDHLRDVYKSWQCNRVVHIGDLVDWHAINYHGRTAGTQSAEAEVAEARRQVATLAKAFPRAQWLLGNHDVLPYRQAETFGLPQDSLRGPIDYWGLPKGWTAHERYGHIEIDGVRYEHGERGPQGINAARNQAIANFQSTAIGHLHAQASVSWIVNQRTRIFGASVGCGADWKKPQFDYGKKFKLKPAISCCVIIDGVYAYIEPMLL